MLVVMDPGGTAIWGSQLGDLTWSREIRKTPMMEAPARRTRRTPVGYSLLLAPSPRPSVEWLGFSLSEGAVSFILSLLLDDWNAVVSDVSVAFFSSSCATAILRGA